MKIRIRNQWLGLKRWRGVILKCVRGLRGGIAVTEFRIRVEKKNVFHIG
jgi:hypothetical protein